VSGRNACIDVILPRMASTTIHHGSYQSIPTSASPGLLFLKAFLPILDSLDPADVALLSRHLSPDATFAINNGTAMPAENVLPMLSTRGQKLSAFGHDVRIAWDIAKEDGSRTLMYESTSSTVFKEDAEGAVAEVKEFNIIELVPAGGGLKADELRTFMDASPVSERARAAMGTKRNKELNH